MFLKEITDIERSEIRLTLQSWLIDSGFVIYKSSKEEVDKHKIKFESGLPFKKNGKIIWFTDKLVALYSYHYDTFGFEQEAIIANEPLLIDDYLNTLKVFNIIDHNIAAEKEVDKLYFDKIIPAKIQSLLLGIGFNVIGISSNKYFYGITKMQRGEYIVTFYTSSISIYEKVEKPKDRLMGTFKLCERNLASYIHVLLSIGIINDEEFFSITEKVKTDIEDY